MMMYTLLLFVTKFSFLNKLGFLVMSSMLRYVSYDILNKLAALISFDIATVFSDARDRSFSSWKLSV